MKREGQVREGGGSIWPTYTEYGDGSRVPVCTCIQVPISSCALMTHNLHPIRDLLISLVLVFLMLWPFPFPCGENIFIVIISIF